MLLRLDRVSSVCDTDSMPAKNSIKTYVDNSYYHIYNRGVNKNLLFLDKQDYAVALSYLKQYLLPKNERALYERLADPNTPYKEKDQIIRTLRLKNYSGKITLLCYCLMPNHFHFLIKQRSKNNIDQFMRSFGTRYGMYFNRRHKRVGQLYQDVYKAVLIESEEQLLHVSKYIHRNPVASRLSKGESFRTQFFSQPSSYPEYLGQRQTSWIHPEDVLAYFSKTNPKLSYQSFVEQENDFSIIQKVAIDL